ncbi:hypothetical protein PHJA_001949600 [Phtheirospermum japonicum]|uniref:Late embryogenesis abundant protein LEA-2 subgroup domain-containing protein n=1 Tax=Phtheirospermum japonicum TaxID=374723 RepID=A0A830CSQ4_9LAMI|nr:hypothetical protein PHJA_001949600 [Phtheirospermum japonicum]
MGSSHSPTGRTNLASCIVATIFLVFILISAFAVYFTVFKPKGPKISVNAVQVPSFSAANSTVSFNFSQYVTVRNPNHAVFNHYDSSLQLLHGGSPVGLLFIPAGKIGPGRTNYIAATFSVRAFPLLSGSARPGTVEPIGADGLGGFRPGGPSMELESRMEMAGRVRVLHFFTHHVEAKVDCRVAIGVSDGSVLGLNC